MIFRIGICKQYKEIELKNQKDRNDLEDDIEKEGCKISFEARYGDIHPKFYILGDISNDLKERISAYASQFYSEGDL